MKRLALVAVGSLFVAMACQDMSTTTSPMVGSEVAGAVGGTAPGNPPPPPIDSGAVGVAGESDGTNTSGQIAFSVTYMLNKPANTGWLKFNKDKNDQTDVDNSAAIKMTNGVFSGKGTIRITADAGIFIIDLSKVSFGAGTSFNECTADVTPTATTDVKPSCFQLDLSGPGVTFRNRAGELKPATFRLFPGYPATDTCVGDIRSETCSISAGT